MADHRINRTLLDFSVSGLEKEHILLKIKELFYDKALPVISSEFDNIEQYLYIDKLELDLGNITLDQFKEIFQNTLKKKINSIPLKNDQKKDQKAQSNFSIDSIFYYLKNGYWDWNFQQKTELELSVLIHAVVVNEVDVATLMKHVAKQDTHIAERLMGLVFADTKLRNSLLSALKKQHEILHPFWPMLSKNWEQKILTKDGFAFVYIRELLIASPAGSLSEVKSLFIRLINTPVFTSFISKKELEKLSAAIEKKQDIGALRSVFTTIQQIFEGKGVDGDKPNITGKRKKLNANEPSFASEMAYSVGEKYFNDVEPERINILNSGLILFHPYLRYAFKDLKWIGDDNKFVSSKAQQKAILFLQYMINGKSRQGEHLLVLNKLLCGWPIHLPVQTACVFSAREKQAAADILGSIKEHWSVIKNTSDRGVIESFIERPGVITRQASGFLLQIERKTIDILLDSLPFGLNTIKLPWNEYIIHTEW